jgi:predicted ATPase/DNA-binding SARP family transcriptional activator
MTDDRLRVRLLGSLEVLRAGAPVGPAGAKRRGLFVLLALEANSVVTVSDLIDRLWGDHPPASAVNLVHTYVSDWRAALEPGRRRGTRARITTVAAGYRLALAEPESDLAQFTALASRGQDASRVGDPVAAASALASALALWRGSALADLAAEPWHAAVVQPLEDARLRAVEDWAAACLAAGTEDAADVAAELHRCLERHPYRERLAELLMWALARQGRQADALRVHDHLRRELVQTLGVDPGRPLDVMLQRVLRQDPTLTATTVTAPTRTSSDRPTAEQIDVAEVVPRTLPIPLDSFLGRQEDLAALAKTVQASRFVTLTGPGGCGKTRLALEFAAAVDPAAFGAVRFVDAAALSDAEQLLDRIAEELEVRVDPAASLADALRARSSTEKVLLVLDNLEHLAGVSSHLPPLLRAAPGLRIVATSRQALRLRGEQSLPVSPLPVEGAGAGEGVGAAVELFWDRATAVNPALKGSHGSQAAVAEICRRVDGLPLAVELTAAWAAVLPLPELAARLAEPLDLLTGGGGDRPARHRTVRATIDWSFQRLSKDEQALLTDLGTFRGGADLEAIADVCGPDVSEPVLHVVAALVHRNLVRPIPGPTTRFGLLETIRAFASERLSASGRAAVVCRRHADHYSMLAENLARQYDGPAGLDWLGRAQQDIANLRGAMETLLDTEPGRALQMVTDCGALWYDAGLVREGLVRLRQALAAAPPDAPARAMAFTAIGWLTDMLNRSHDAQRHVRRAIALARTDGDRLVEAHALQALGDVLFGHHQDTEARRVLHYAIAVARDSEGLPVRYGETAPFNVIGDAAHALGWNQRWMNLPESRQWLQESWRCGVRSGFRPAIGASLACLGWADLLAGDFAAAQRRLAEADDLLRDGRGGIVYRGFSLSGLAQVCFATEDFAGAERWTRRCLDLLQDTGLLGALWEYARLADICIETRTWNEAHEALDKVAWRSPAGELAAIVPVRRARLARLTGQPALIPTLLTEAEAALPSDQMLPERLIWYVESAYAALGAGQGGKAVDLCARAETHARRAGLAIVVTERRRLEDVRARWHRSAGKAACSPTSANG